MKISAILCILAFGASAAVSNAFAPSASTAFTRSTSTSSAALDMAKGFGDEKEPKGKGKSAGQVDREKKSNKYDEIAGTGGQEYSVFVRQFGSDDQSWLPCGSIAVPRGAQVSNAVFANESGLKSAIPRTYPKLAGFEDEFEFGFNLKIYPDDPIEVAAKGGGANTGPSIGNWISNLLSPVDASAVQQPPPPKE